jgi:hypothetical protein
MVDNFTPLNIEKIKGKNNYVNTILLFIVTLTMAVLAVVLFILIQRKINEQKAAVIEPTPTIESKPTETPTPTLLPTIFQKELTPTPEASETPILSVTPATKSSEINH